MKSKPIVLRELAAQDIDDALSHYIEAGGESAALGFVDAVESAFRHIGAHPGSGSPRYSVELDLPDLRSWQLARFPYLIFYFEHEKGLDVWRVLHALRDIPAWLRPTE